MNAKLNKIAQYLTDNAARLGTDYKKTIASATDAVSALVETFPNWESACNQMNQKALFRFIQSVDFIVSGSVNRYDAVSAGMCAIVLLANESQVSFENARFALSSTGNEDSRLPKGVMGARLRKILGLTRRGTVESKVSRTVGKNGYLTCLGITVKGDAHGFTITDKQHPFLIAHGVALSRLSDSALNLLQDKLNK
jgi:hypothetical protein